MQDPKSSQLALPSSKEAGPSTSARALTCECMQGSSGQERVSRPMAPFDQPFHLVVNLAVGGNFCGYPAEGASPQLQRALA